MSFILDALKKSEIERQRQAVPGLIDLPAVSKRRGLPWWGYWIGALLLVNVAVLSVLLLRNARGPAPVRAAAAPRPRSGQGAATPDATPDATLAAAPGAVAGSAAPPATPPGGDQAEHHFSPLDNAPQYAPEIPVANETRAPRTARHVDPLLNAAQSAAEDDEVLPSVNELNLSGQQSLPELHLDVHVYATRSAERFVYINMRKYHEGATLQEGPVLEHIRRDGAVLNFHGLRFLLPRQS